MDIARPVRAEVDSVSFSFYTEDDIRKLAVKEITNPDPFDNLDHPNKDGVYDPCLGPLDKGDRWVVEDGLFCLRIFQVGSPQAID